MVEFRISKKSKKSRARLGILRTPHGEIETPALVTVATQAAVKTLEPQEAAEAKSSILIANTYHLHSKPGEKVIKAGGGLHKFMNWSGPLMTDSGGFQVFSLGFGRDLKMSKVSKSSAPESILHGQQPKLLKITHAGVWFSSPFSGEKMFLGPKESMRIQEKLGADIMFTFDECPPPVADRRYVEHSLEKTHKWAEICLKAKRTDQALYGIVQGGKFKDLRIKSAKKIGSMDFPGFGIGGEFGNDKKTMFNMLNWTAAELPESKPRHLLGIGYLEDMPLVVKAGIDTFDCVVPTRFARHGIAFTSAGRLDMGKTRFLKDRKPLDPKCPCRVCGSYSRSYLHHLFRAGEIGALKLLTFHNLHFFNTKVEDLRNGIKKGKI